MCVRHLLYVHVCVTHSLVESICNLNMYQLNGDIPTKHLGCWPRWGSIGLGSNQGQLGLKIIVPEPVSLFRSAVSCPIFFDFAVVINLPVISWHNNELRITWPSLFPRLSNGIK